MHQLFNSIITANDHVIIERTKDVAFLFVKKLSRSDSGQYFFTMENTAGRKEACITVNVYGNIFLHCRRGWVFQLVCILL